MDEHTRDTLTNLAANLLACQILCAALISTHQNRHALTAEYLRMATKSDVLVGRELKNPDLLRVYFDEAHARILGYLAD